MKTSGIVSRPAKQMALVTAAALSLLLTTSLSLTANADNQVSNQAKPGSVNNPKVIGLVKSPHTPAATPDELIILPKQDLEKEDLDESLAKIGGKVERMDPLGKFMLVKVDPKKIDEELKEAKKDPNFAIVERNGISKTQVSFTTTPNDPGFSQQADLQQLDIPNAWALGAAGQGIKVASLDTGCDFFNPDLYGRFVSMGFNVVTQTPNGYDYFGPYSDGISHGTFTMTTYGGSTNNNFGFAAPAFQAGIYPVNISPDSDSSTDFYIQSAIAVATIQACKVANLSFGISNPNYSLYAANQHAGIKYMILYYGASGGMLFIAAGNDGNLIPNGVDTPGSVVVSALNPDLTPAAFTDYGPATVFATPGVMISQTAFGGQAFTESGTSISSPLAAGVFSQIWSANPGLSAQQVLQIMEQTASVPTGAPQQYYGFGIPDAAAGVSLAQHSL